MHLCVAARLINSEIGTIRESDLGEEKLWLSCPDTHVLSHLVVVSYTNKAVLLVYAWHVGKAVYCCAHAVQ